MKVSQDIPRWLGIAGIIEEGHKVRGFTAFCLMSNHVHLAIQVGEVSLSRILQNLSFRYTRWVNWCQGRSGHLFQGRYQAVLVDADGNEAEGNAGWFDEGGLQGIRDQRGRIEGMGQRSPIIGSERDGGVVDSGTGGKHTWGIGEGDGP